MDELARLPSFGRPGTTLRAGGTPSPTLSRSNSLASSLASEGPVCRYCWEPETEGNPLVSPCACQGTSSQVHYRCLVRWMSSSFYWASPNTVASMRPASCELCRRPFFEASPARRNLLLQTAQLEWQAEQLHSAAGRVAEAEATPALARWGRSALALATKAQTSYWRLALRPVQAAMLYCEVWRFVSRPPEKKRGLLGLVIECIQQVGAWGSGAFTGWALRFLKLMATQGGSKMALCVLLQMSAAAASDTGSDIAYWLATGNADACLSALRLPITAPLFAWWASGLALLGALLPGRVRGADGLRVAAGLPLRAAKWVLSGEGRARIWHLLGRATVWLHGFLLRGGSGAGGGGAAGKS